MNNIIGISASGLPGPKSRELMELREQNVARGISYALPVFASETRGALVEDVDGNVLIDFVGGIGVVNFGHNNPAVVEAVKSKLIATCTPALWWSAMNLMSGLRKSLTRSFRETSPKNRPCSTAALKL